MSDNKMEKEKSGADLRYGVGPWKPSCLQCLNKAGFYVFFMFLGNVFMSMTANGLIGVVLSNLETRFELSSSQSSWIASAYEVAAIPAMLIVALFGHRFQRPLLSGSGLLLMVFGALLLVVPHFATGVYLPNSGRLDHGLCMTEENSLNGTIERGCGQGEGQESGYLSRYLIMFIIARLLMGFGAVPTQTLGVTYMDDVSSKQNFSLYVAIYFAGGVLGPALGYIGGGYMLQLFTDFPSVKPDEIGISRSDPRWVGAWWLGFLIGGVCLFISSVPLLFYANDLPGAAALRAEKVSEASGEEVKEVHENLANATWAELWNMIKKLFTNLTFIFITLTAVTDAFMITGFAAFGPKYVESQFSVSSSVSGMLFGLISIPGGVGGTLAGGWAIKRFKLKVRGILKLEIILNFVLVLACFCFFITCKPVNFAGVTVHYPDQPAGDSYNLSASCNAHCDCDTVSFNPVCGVNNVQFFSPCHAGCTELDNFPGKEFFSCSCIGNGTSDVKMAEQTTCSSESCTLLPLFLVLFFIGMFIIFFNSAMNCTLTLRCVASDVRELAIGLQGIFNRLLGTFPGPLAFGAAFDLACILWQKTCTGGRGSCRSYDNSKMSIFIYIFGIGIKVFSLIFLICAYKLYKQPQVQIREVTVDQGMKSGGKGVESPVFEVDDHFVKDPQVAMEQQKPASTRL